MFVLTVALRGALICLLEMPDLQKHTPHMRSSDTNVLACVFTSRSFVIMPGAAHRGSLT